MTFKTLAIGHLIEVLTISQRSVATAMGISPAALTNIIRRNEWPKRADIDALKRKAEDALRDAGATEQQLQAIWQSEPEAIDEVDLDETFWEPEMLTETAKRHFKISRDPFQNEINSAEDVYLNTANSAMLTEIKSAALGGSMLAVIGECGSGKTIIKRKFLAEISQDPDLIVIEPRRIDRKKITAEGISAAICRAMRLKTGGMNGEDRDAMIEDALVESTRNGNRHLLIVDEAHDLPTEVIKLIKRVWELTAGFSRVMGVVLIGQPELKNKLSGTYVREFTLRCAQFEVAPLAFDIPAYVRHKFARAGMDADKIFNEDALRAIRGKCLVKRKLGINSGQSDMLDDRSFPLKVNNVVIKALNIAAHIDEDQIDEKFMLQEV